MKSRQEASTRSLDRERTGGYNNKNGYKKFNDGFPTRELIFEKLGRESVGLGPSPMEKCQRGG